MEEDTIVAVATPPGQGGIGVVRLSGPDALRVARRLCPARRRWRDRFAAYVTVCDAQGHALDEAVVTFFRGPRSYTGEDVVELSCHGNPLVLDRAVAAALAHGCRPARPGEFTLRAFLAGKVDLAQAEAIVDLVQARTDAGLGLALQQLEGALSRRVEPLHDRLLDVLAHATALVDFSEDDIPPLAAAEITQQLAAAACAVEGLLAGARQGAVIRHGVALAIVGAPNVGKSSMLNALLGRERAIVTPIAGTTRDTLEEQLDLAGITFHVVDTAGITATDDPVERIGVERSRVALAAADIALIVLDASRPLDDADRAVAGLAVASGAQPLVALNKSDLPPCLSPTDLPNGFDPVAVVTTSSVARNGLEELCEALPRLALGGMPTDGFVVSNQRHIAALRETHAALQRALDAQEARLPLDLVSFDIRAAVAALGSITGADVSDELLDRVFSRFCIGK